MENKKKPSLVVAVPDCDELDALGFEITSEMPYWKIGQYQENPYKDSEEIRATILRRVLMALMNLGPFNAVISLEVDEEKKIINYAKRVWVQIRLNGQVVLTLSYHSTHENEQYFEPADWLEFEISSSLSEERWNERMLDILNTVVQMSIKDWELFFRNKILKRALFLREKAKKKIEDAAALEESGHQILLSLL